MPESQPSETPKEEPPPEIQIPESSLKSGLLDADLNLVDRYITYWVDKLSQADEEGAILDARTRLVRGYVKYDSWQYQNVYAGQVSKAIAPLLESRDYRKQINAALALTQMPQVTVQPALELLVVSPNPALRFYGWVGYRRIRMLVLAQGMESVAVMLNSLSRAATAEDNGPVMGAVLAMMYLDPDRPSMVTPALFQETQTRLFVVFRQAWLRVCQKVLEGDPVMGHAASDGLSALRRMGAGLGSRGEIGQGAVQMVVDMMWCAAKVYVKAAKAGMPTASVEALLRDCEGALNAITELRRIPMTEALASKGDTDRAAEVDAAIGKWLRFLENANWPVKEPKFEISPEAATQESSP
jgi:hypothetical protein